MKQAHTHTPTHTHLWIHSFLSVCVCVPEVIRKREMMLWSISGSDAQFNIPLSHTALFFSPPEAFGKTSARRTYGLLNKCEGIFFFPPRKTCSYTRLEDKNTMKERLADVEKTRIGWEMMSCYATLGWGKKKNPPIKHTSKQEANQIICRVLREINVIML